MARRRQVMDREGMRRTLARLAAEIAEANEPEAVLVGIHTRGVPLALRLAEMLSSYGEKPPVGSVDITLYRDDVGPWRPAHAQPLLRETRLPVPVEGRTIYLVDDVLFTGRTVRAAIDALLDYGRPRAIRLVVLVDRGHRELPIAADFVGVELDTTKEEDVQVRVKEVDGEDGVWVVHG